jgi:hypothetical protein
VARVVTDLFSSSLAPQKDRTFRIVIAYEDFETGQHARYVCDYLAERLAPECRFLSQMWRFDVLRIPECRESAVKGAAAADVIMISTHGVGDLPGDVKAWIELWLRDKGDLLALVALFDRPRGQVGQDWPIQDYLASVAERGQISFFAEPDTWPGRGPHQEYLPLEPSAEGNTQPPLPLRPVTTPDSDAAHWGINE